MHFVGRRLHLRRPRAPAVGAAAHAGLRAAAARAAAPRRRADTALPPGPGLYSGFDFLDGIFVFFEIAILIKGDASTAKGVPLILMDLGVISHRIIATQVAPSLAQIRVSIADTKPLLPMQSKSSSLASLL